MTANEIFLWILLPTLLGQGVLIRLALVWWQRRKLTIEHEQRVEINQTQAIANYVEQYYLRYINLTETLCGMLEKQVRGTPEEDLQMSFFRFTQWLCARFKWDKEVNSIILLGNAVGEELLARIMLDIHRDCFSMQSVVTLEDCHTLANTLEDYPEMVPFFNKFRDALGSPPLADIFERYKEWLLDMKEEDRKRLCTELQYFCRIFSYEIRVCYQSWYKRKPVKPAVDKDFILRKLDKLCNESKISKTEKEDYLKSVTEKENYLKCLGIPLN